MMIVRKTVLAASLLALMSTPAWALPSRAPSNHGTGHAPSTTPAGPPSTTPNNTDNPGASNRSQNGNHSGDKGAGDNGNHGSGQDNHGQGNRGQGEDPGKHAHPSHPQHPKHPGHPNHPSRPGNPHKCMPHNIGYIASGTLVSQTLTENPNGTYSGNMTVDVTHTNRHATSNEGTTTTYTLTDVRVRSDLAEINHHGSVGLDDLQAGDRVKLIGKITALARRCSQSGFTATTTIRQIVLHPPPAG